MQVVDATPPTESVTETVAENDPTAVGVPLNAPAALNVSPEGRAPLETEKEL